MKDIKYILNGPDPVQVFHELKKVKFKSIVDKIELTKNLVTTWEFFAQKHSQGKLYYRPSDPEDVQSVTSSVEVFSKGKEIDIQFNARFLENTFSINLSKDAAVKFKIVEFLQKNLKLSEFIDGNEKSQKLDKPSDSGILINLNKIEKTISIKAIDEKNKSDSKNTDHNPGLAKIIEQRNEIKIALTKGNEKTKYSFPKIALALLNNDLDHYRLNDPNIHVNNLKIKISNKIEGVEVPRKSSVRGKGINI